MKSSGKRNSVMFENAHQNEARSSVPQISIRTERNGRFKYATTATDNAEIKRRPNEKTVDACILIPPYVVFRFRSRKQIGSMRLFLPCALLSAWPWRLPECDRCGCSVCDG